MNAVSEVEFFYDDFLNSKAIIQFCDILSHPEADGPEDNHPQGFVTIGDIEENIVPELKKVDNPTGQILRFRKGLVRQVMKASTASKGRMTPTASEVAITAQLEAISDDRHSSDFVQTKLSSGLGGRPQEAMMMSNHKLKEIRTYVAHQIFRVQKRIDESFADIEKQTAIVKGLSKQDFGHEGTAKKQQEKTLQEAQVQVEASRAKLSDYQTRYNALKEIRKNLQKLQKGPSEEVELEILRQYDNIRSKTRNQANQLGSSTWSAASAELEKAYSDMTSSGQSTFDKFYQRWGGIIRSGEQESHKYLEEYARFKLEHDDDNLRFAKQFQHTMNQLQVMKSGNKV